MSGGLEESLRFGFGEMEGEGDFYNPLPLLGFTDRAVEPVRNGALWNARKFEEAVDTGVSTVQVFS